MPGGRARAGGRAAPGLLGDPTRPAGRRSPVLPDGPASPHAAGSALPRPPGRTGCLRMRAAEGPGPIGLGLEAGQLVVGAGPLPLLSPWPPTAAGWGGAQAGPLCSRDWGPDHPDAPRESGASLCLGSWGPGSPSPRYRPDTCSQFPCFPPSCCPEDGAADGRDERKLGRPPILWAGHPGQPRPRRPGGAARCHPHLRAAASCGHSGQCPPWPCGRVGPNEDVYSLNHQMKCSTLRGSFPAQPRCGFI